MYDESYKYFLFCNNSLISQENQPQPKRRKKTVPSTRNPAPVKPVKPVLPKRSKPTTVQSKPTTSKSASTKLPSTIEVYIYFLGKGGGRGASVT